MKQSFSTHIPFWSGVLAVVITASALIVLVGSPTAQALPPPAALQQAYPPPTATPAIDLIADKIEVTQAVQDLNNSVRLVKNKRTFVRFHVHSSGGTAVTTARLTVQRDAQTAVLSPINPGGTILVRTAPDRAALHHAFLFELPAGFKEGTVTLTARVNPDNNPAESSYTNNATSTSVTFEAAPPVNLVMYKISYRIGSTTYIAPDSHRDQMLSWLRRAYPLSELRVWNRTLDYGSGSASGGALTNPSCGSVNARLSSAKMLDIIYKWLGVSNIPTSAHYYGMVSDGGGFMRGCAVGIPHAIASGPTGTATWGWDFDGSYGDWYGGHELAHTYGRYHAMFCGAAGGAAYPYSQGAISPSSSGAGALYGFDIGNQVIYGPQWKDLMTYCSNQWVSDFTYEGLLDYFKSTPVSASSPLVLAAPGDRLLVSGVIDPETLVTELAPIYRVPNVEEVTPPTPGDFAIVLRDAANHELARYPFTPVVSESGPTDIPGERAVSYLLISELVPYVAGTTRVEIVGPGGQVLATAAPGSAAPQVTLTAPNGGETLDGSAVEVTWDASDPDSDPLTFMVQYSPDGGQTWVVVAQNVTGNRVTIDGSNLTASQQARFRVWATDGLNTTFDDSNGDSIVPARTAQVTILSPADGSSFTSGQTVALQGAGSNSLGSVLQDADLEWRSDRDGALGTGALLSLSTLSVGQHTITLRTADGQGGFATDTIQITIFAEGQAPTTPDALAVAPTTIVLDNATNRLAAVVNVDNLNAETSIGWSASTAASWLTLNQSSDVTPGTFTVRYTGDQPLGVYTATIQVTSSAQGVTPVDIPVSLTLREVQVYLPAINR